MKKLVSLFLVLALALGCMSFAAAEDGWITLRVEAYDREITGFDVTNCWQLKYAQEHFGDPNKIKLEFVSYARWTEGDLLTNALAGGNAPDICVTYNGSLVQQCIDDEGIWQLDDLLNEYGKDIYEGNSADVWGALTGDDGNIYGVPYCVPHPREINSFMPCRLDLMKAAGIEPDVQPIRGGTDGARLSFMGLPCPNIFTGGANFHGRFEYLPLNSLKKAGETVLQIAVGAGKLNKK
jgi:ABC-type glycerol-3-phosphate transport system substrate-binding protein